MVLAGMICILEKSAMRQPNLQLCISWLIFANTYVPLLWATRQVDTHGDTWVSIAMAGNMCHGVHRAYENKPHIDTGHLYGKTVGEEHVAKGQLALHGAHLKGAEYIKL